MKKCTMALLGVVLTGSVIAGPWTTFDLTDRTADWGGLAVAHDNGHFVVGENGSFYRQDAFGGGAYTTYSGSLTHGPASIATGAGDAVVTAGGWAPTELVTFDASNTGSAFSPSGVSVQTYVMKKRDTSSLYVMGANGSAHSGGNSNNLSYVTLDGLVNKTLINDISTYSCGFAMDAGGNLYVGDNDDGGIYYFSKSQLDSAISGSALDITDGTFVVDFGGGGDMTTLAVDDNGVLWGAGWAHNGIQSYDPNLDQFYNWTPGFDSTHYAVDTFSFGGSNYVGFVSASGSASGSDVVYGFADTSVIPEPNSVVLLVMGAGGLVWFRRRRKYFFN